MKRNGKPGNKKIVAFLLGFLYAALGLSPVWADDTEIYFGNPGGGATANILFVLDTSGSMDKVDNDVDPNNTLSRMQQLKNSMNSLLDSLTNVNVGIMRFNNPGGPVLYPVSNLNSQATGTGIVNNTVSVGTDDGYQFTTGTAVQVMDRAGLELGAQAPAGVTISQASNTIVTSTSAGLANDVSNDVEGASYYPNEKELFFPYSKDGHQRINGLRFPSISIPKNATITRAYLQLEAWDINAVDALPLQIDIFGEPADKGAFSSTATMQPASRIKNTNLLPQVLGAATPITWSMDKLPASDDSIRSTDIAPIIQGMVNNSYWGSTSGTVTLLFQRTPSSLSKSWLGISAADRKTSPPKLVVEYYTGTATASAVTTAVRFPQVFVPKGATIKGAFLNLTAQQSDTNAAAIAVSAEASGNSPAITSTAKIVGRSSTSSSVTWSTAAGNLTSWTANNTYQTPDLRTVIQEVVSRSDWCGGNAITVLLKGSAGQRVASALEDGAALAPQLNIQYDPATVPETGTCMNGATIVQINNASDDAEDYNSTIALSDSTLEMASKGSGNYTQKVGFMFRNIQIPQGQTISSAYIQFVAAASNSQSITLSITGENTSSPADFSSTARLTGRTYLSNPVSWTPEAWTGGSTYKTPDISSVIQALVNRSDWASGKNMSLMVTGPSTSSSNIRAAYSYDRSSSYGAKLYITYQNSLAPKITVRDLLRNTINDLTADGYTPIQDTMYEAALYFSGSNVVYGSQRGGTVPIVSTTSGSPSAKLRISNAKSFTNGLIVRPAGCTEANLSDPSCAGEKIAPVNLPGANGQYSSGAKYISPVTVSCQINHVVLLTDGIANMPHSNALIKTLAGVSSCTNNDSSDGRSCVSEVVDWLRKGDMAPSVQGKQGVITDTVAFHLGGTDQTSKDAVAFLNDLAITGGSPNKGVYQASTADQLSQALNNIVGQVSNTNTSFVSAGTAVNAFNRAINRDELYFSVFQPSLTPSWPGNIKKYKSGMIGTTPAILDKNSANAVDSNGFFAAGSTDFWNSSGTADGPDVSKGGAASLITNYATRKIYTYLDDIASPSKTLTNAVNNLSSSNTNLTLAEMGGALPTGAASLADWIDWVRGKDVQNTTAPGGTRFVFADPLHSRPVAITYGGTDANPDISVFVSTNSGFLHAINNDTGAEQFAFIPKELLPLQKTLFENLASVPHPYGLDGSITAWVKDPEGDGVVLDSSNALQSGNGVYLYIGMRRGRRNYYALDVSDRSNPKVLWVIKGGTTTGFNNLGQTWSQPLKTRVNVGGAVRDVLIFAGGYASNNNQDNSAQRDINATDVDGNAIYIVDATDGSLIWSATSTTTGFSDMKYSIPSNIAGADINGDGLMDVLFVGDMGGQLWRFDVKNGQSGSGLVTGGVIADLNAAGSTATPANNRRFFQAPALFLGATSANKPYLGVAVGSGYRAHPLDVSTEDNFYMIKQYDVFAAPTAYTKLTEANLYDATDNVIGEGTSTQKTAALTDLDAANGWFISMDNQGEKVLSQPLVVEGQVFFDTYQPGAPPNNNPCAPASGITRSYTMSAFDATPVNDINGMVGLQASDRSQIINSAGIIDTQRQIVKVVNGELRNFGIEGQNIKNLPSDLLNKVHRIYWYENR